jgi:hypothetical protein
LATGIRNPQAYVKDIERLKYYKSWMENSDMEVTIYTISSENDFVQSFNKVSDISFPIMILTDIKSGTLYSLDCYEDMDYTLELIDGNKFDELDIASDSTLLLIKDLSENHIDKKSFYRKGVTSTDNRYKVDLVHGVFLGNKIKKRIGAFLNGLENISSVTIYDLSIDKTV